MSAPENTRIGHLLLPSSEAQLQRAYRLADALGVDRCTILSLRSAPPYLCNDFFGRESVESWHKWGVDELAMNRFWLEQYPELEALAHEAVAAKADLSPRARTSHFLLSVAWDLGLLVTQPLLQVDAFLGRSRPAMIHLGSLDEFGVAMMTSLAGKHAIPLAGDLDAPA